MVDGTFDHTILDTAIPKGLIRPRPTAQRLETPPYYAYPVRPGITFTIPARALQGSPHDNGRRCRPKHVRGWGNQPERSQGLPLVGMTIGLFSAIAGRRPHNACN